MAAWDRETFELAMREREVDLTTYGRKTGQPRRMTIWIWGGDGRLFIRSGGGLGRDWPRNLLARNEGILHLAGRDIPVLARHVTDPAEARACTELVAAKYGPNVTRSGDPNTLTPGETATFELTPDPEGTPSA